MTQENDVFTEPDDAPVPESTETPVETTTEVPAPVETPAPVEKSDREKYEELQIALRQERSSSKEIKGEVETLRQQLAQFQTLKEELENRRKEAAAEKERMAFEENPAEYLKRQTEALQQKIGELSQAEKDTIQKFEQQQALETTVRTQASAFAQATPDYIDAFKFVRDRKFAEYELYGVPPEQRDQMFHQESMQFAQHAVANQRNAAEMVYNLAKTWGYTQQQKAPTAEEKVVNLQNGQKAAQTLSTGTAPVRESMLSRVEEMSDEEFDKFWKEEINPRRRA